MESTNSFGVRFIIQHSQKKLPGALIFARVAIQKYAQRFFKRQLPGRLELIHLSVVSEVKNLLLLKEKLVLEIAYEFGF